MNDKKINALKLALENICAAKLCEFNSMSSRHEMIRLMDAAITAIREARADQPAQPSQRSVKPWVGPTSEDKVEILRANGEAAVLILTEAKLREKNA